MKLWSLISLCVLGALAIDPTLAAAKTMSMLPCDIFALGGTPCVAAHGVVRALYVNFTGALYQVLRESDNTKKTSRVSVQEASRMRQSKMHFAREPKQV